MPEKDFSSIENGVLSPMTWSVIKYNNTADNIADTAKPLYKAVIIF